MAAQTLTPSANDPSHGRTLAHVQPGRGGESHKLLIVVLLVALVYAAVIELSVRHYGGNLSSLIAVGAQAKETEPAGLGHHVVVFRKSDGYDGQTFYYVADDPFLQHRAFRDPFRYQRIGYPLAIWAASFGRREWRPTAMVAVNYVADLAVALLSGLIIISSATGASIWLALPCAINPSLLIATQLDLAEPMAMALCLAGLLAFLRRRVAWAMAAFAFAMLTREVSILFIVPLIASELARKRFKQTALIALAIVPYLVWQAVLLESFGHSGSAASQGNFDLPFVGIRAVLAAAHHTSIKQAIVHQGSIVAVIVFVCLCLVVAVQQMRRKFDVVVGSMSLHAAAALFAAPGIWLAFTSAARVFGGLYPLTVLSISRHRRLSLALLVGASILLTVLTVIRSLIISPTLAYYLTS